MQFRRSWCLAAAAALLAPLLLAPAAHAAAAPASEGDADAEGDSAFDSKDTSDDVDSRTEELSAQRDDLKAQLATKNTEFLKQHRRADRLEKKVSELQAALKAELKKEHDQSLSLGQARSALKRLSSEAASAVAAVAAEVGAEVADEDEALGDEEAAHLPGHAAQHNNRSSSKATLGKAGGGAHRAGHKRKAALAHARAGRSHHSKPVVTLQATAAKTAPHKADSPTAAPASTAKATPHKADAPPRAAIATVAAPPAAGHKASTVVPAKSPKQPAASAARKPAERAAATPVVVVPSKVAAVAPSKISLLVVESDTASDVSLSNDQVVAAQPSAAAISELGAEQPSELLAETAEQTGPTALTEQAASDAVDGGGLGLGGDEDTVAGAEAETGAEFADLQAQLTREASA